MGNRCSNIKPTIDTKEGSSVPSYVALWIALHSNSEISYELRMHPSISTFEAFPGAAALLGDKINERSLRDVARGVRVSRPLDVYGLKNNYKHEVFASVSHRGIFAASGRRDHKTVVDFTDLLSGQRVSVRVEHWTLVGFYNNKSLLVTSGQCLRELDMQDVFTAGGLARFNPVSNVKVGSPFTDVTLLNTTRKLFFTTGEHKAYRFDVDTHKTKRVFRGIKVCSFASLTGISMGHKVIFCEHENHYRKFVADSSGRILSQIRSCNFMPVSPIIIQSSASPKNISKCVVISWGEVTTGVYSIRRAWPRFLKVSGFISIVRLFQDVFIAYNRKSGKWVIVKIEVS